MSIRQKTIAYNYFLDLIPNRTLRAKAPWARRHISWFESHESADRAFKRLLEALTA